MPAWSWAAPEGFYRSRRLRAPERMDDPALAPAERDEALRGLRQVAAWPGQREPLFKQLSQLLGAPGPRRKLIEVGAGDGHLSCWLQERLQEQGHRVEVLATDRVAVPGVKKLDAVRGALPEADIYFSNLLLHHLSDPDLTAMLKAQSKASRIGWAHYDLHRHWLHYYGAALFISLSTAPRIILQDGLCSIQQGYTRADLRALAPEARASWHFPFRWMLTWQRRRSS